MTIYLEIIFVLIALYTAWHGYLNHKHHADHAAYIWWAFTVISLLLAIVMYVHY